MSIGKIIDTNSDHTNHKVGILIKKPESIFSNGCIQQVLFLKKLLANTGAIVHFLSVELDYTRFELTDEAIIFTDASFDFSPFHCVILGSLVLSGESNIPYIRNLEKYNIPVINLICGNLFVLHQEEFVFNTHHIISNYIKPYVTENWIMEMYDYSLDYVRMLSSKSSKIVPYTWDTDIIEAYIKQNNLFKCPNSKDRSKVNLLLFEPNMSIHKNALIPLLICEEFYKQNPDSLNKIYAFCSDGVIQNMNVDLMQHLTIFKNKKIEVYGRIIMPYIVDAIDQNNPFLNIVVSYNLLNRLNFIHLELFHIGVPIVHNCEPFRQNGYYFEDFDLFAAVRLIKTIQTSFDKQTYQKRCKQIIETFSSSNANRIDKYKELLMSIGKTTATTSSPVDGDNPLPSTIFVPAHPLFRQGEGYLFVIRSSSDVETTLSSIRHLAKTHSKINIEVIVRDHLTSNHLEDSISNIHNPDLTVNIICRNFSDNETIDSLVYFSSFLTAYYLDPSYDRHARPTTHVFHYAHTRFTRLT